MKTRLELEQAQELARLAEQAVKYKALLDEAGAELARLREENDREVQKATDLAVENARLRPMEHKYAEALNREAELDIENARLREEVQGYRNQKFKTDYEVENAGLREKVQLVEGAARALDSENRSLREALKKIADSNHQDTCEGNYGAPLEECTCHVAIARNALKETGIKKYDPTEVPFA